MRPMPPVGQAILSFVEPLASGIVPQLLVVKSKPTNELQRTFDSNDWGIFVQASAGESRAEQHTNRSGVIW